MSNYDMWIISINPLLFMEDDYIYGMMMAFTMFYHDIDDGFFMDCG